MTLAMLDIDGFRIDKGLTITIDAQAHWSNSIRTCAKRFGKENFYISGTHISKTILSDLCLALGLSSTRLPDMCDGN